MIQDDSSDFDKEEIECAIALSLSDADQKGKKVVGKLLPLYNIMLKMRLAIQIG